MLDMGRVFGGIVGQSEANLRSVIRTAEAIAEWRDPAQEDEKERRAKEFDLNYVTLDGNIALSGGINTGVAINSDLGSLTLNGAITQTSNPNFVIKTGSGDLVLGVEAATFHECRIPRHQAAVTVLGEKKRARQVVK